MSAVTINPGTQSTSLFRRLVLQFMAQPLLRSGRHAERVTSALTAGTVNAIPRTSEIETPHPLDDLQSATWEDAEWQ